ncbi:MAG: hypothetical protein ACR2MP_04190 [Streptosporangiaceae bacterium]
MRLVSSTVPPRSARNPPGHSPAGSAAAANRRPNRATCGDTANTTPVPPAAGATTRSTTGSVRAITNQGRSSRRPRHSFITEPGYSFGPPNPEPASS